MAIAIRAAGGSTARAAMGIAAAMAVSARLPGSGPGRPVDPGDLSAAIAEAGIDLPPGVAVLARHAADAGYAARIDLDRGDLSIGPDRVDEPVVTWPTWSAIATLRAIGLAVGLEREEIPAREVARAAREGADRVGTADAALLEGLAAVARYALDTYGPDAAVGFW